MSDYNNNKPNKLEARIAKMRGKAVYAVLAEHQAVSVVAARFGVHRTTIWRWIRRWKEINKHVSQIHYGRPNRVTRFQPVYYRWIIPAYSSAPINHPGRIKEDVVRRILELRDRNKRCAEVIFSQLRQENIKISLSSVKRILDRNERLNKWSKWKKKHPHVERPQAIAPGALVEVDTVHYVNQLSGERKYITTVIDLYSRMSFALCSSRILPGNSLRAVLRAQEKFGFKFSTVQSDNGCEFSNWFSERLKSKGIKHRHTRVRKPNDNAHIERFNRTLREECIGQHLGSRETCETINERLCKYLDYYNNERIHLGLQCRTPMQMLQR